MHFLYKTLVQFPNSTVNHLLKYSLSYILCLDKGNPSNAYASKQTVPDNQALNFSVAIFAYLKKKNNKKKTKSMFVFVCFYGLKMNG